MFIAIFGSIESGAIYAIMALGVYLIMMDQGEIIFEVSNSEKKEITIEKLLAEFHRIKGTKMAANDRALLQ